MNRSLYSHTLTTGLAIFSMLFGAGNLMYPIEVGMYAGQFGYLGILGFMITAVCMPVLGLITMILFDGNYKEFFNRIGKKTGELIQLICFLIIGPLIAIPRIVNLSHTMVGPFIPLPLIDGTSETSNISFAIIFLGITYLASRKENRIIDILGYLISPLLVISLLIIIVQGLIQKDLPTHTMMSATEVFKKSLISGYETLDLLGALFFSSTIISLLKRSMNHEGVTKQDLMKVTINASILGSFLLGIIYIGMGLLGMYHGHGLQQIQPDQLFRLIAQKVTNHYGAAIIGTAVLMACLSTAIALSTVVAEYFQYTIFHKKFSYDFSLRAILIFCFPLAITGLSTVRMIAAGPLLYIGYPVLICITICNLLYKTVGFTAMRSPIMIASIGFLLFYFIK